MQKHRANGFTLLELAIVLIVIGLIAGGIVLGRSLLTNSQVQTVMTDADNYITAVGNFKQQFQALPGDMANATDQWGNDGNGCIGLGGSSGTCNGNGDGIIGNDTPGLELFASWQHLFYAGMLNKRFNGVSTYHHDTGPHPGMNVPQGSMEGSGFNLAWIPYGGSSGMGARGVGGSVANGDANFYPGFYGNVLQFGAPNGALGASGPILTTHQAAAIDAKMDDGVPSTGKIRSLINGSVPTPGCAASATAYNTGAIGKLCSLMFITGY